MNKTHSTKAIHIGKLLVPSHKPKLAKEYGCPNADRKENEKARAYNKVYKSLGNRWLN
ncbi:MAG: hypothetical protein WBK40_04200 [Bacteroidales bacterium]